MSLKESVHFIWIVRFVGLKLLTVSPYYLFSICRVYSDVSSSSPVIGSSVFSFFFPWKDCLQVNQFYWSLQRTSFESHWVFFFYCFSFFLCHCFMFLSLLFPSFYILITHSFFLSFFKEETEFSSFLTQAAGTVNLPVCTVLMASLNSGMLLF